MREQGVAPGAPEALAQISRLYEHFAETCCPSLIQFSGFFAGFYQDTEGGNFIDQEFGKGYAAYLTAAVKSFAENYEGRTLDNVFQDALDTIHTLARKKHTASSAEVQEQVRRVHDYFRDVGIKSTRLQINRLRQIATVFGSDVVREAMDGSAKRRGFAWVLSRAIEIYCNNLEKSEALE